MAEDIITQTPEPGSKKKTAVMMTAILIVEAAVIVGAFFLVGGPPDVSAMSSTAAIEAAADERVIEMLVLDDRLPNNKSGITYIYDTEIYVQVKQRYEAQVSGELDQFENEIRAEINAVWKTSEPQHFQEPMLETLTRKIYAMFDERFGADQETGERIIAKCVIVMGTGMRIDS
jgi:flagellar basal body-associated protein FliL